MTRPGPVAGLAVSADLTISVTAPDGSATRIRVSDSAGELLVDVDDPLTVMRALPQREDRRALVNHVRALTTATGTWPAMRIRTRGRTLAVSQPGRTRPGPAMAGVAAAAGLGAAVALVALVVITVRRLVGRRET